MNSDSEKQIESLKDEIKELHKDIAYLKGEQAGRTRMLNIIIPIAMIIFGILSFTALGTFFNNLFTDQLEKMVDEKLTSDRFSEMFKGYIATAQVAVDQAQAQAEQAQAQAEKAQDASNESEKAFGKAADKANEAEQSAKTAEVQANEAGQAAETAQVQASEVAVKATEVQSVLSTPTPP